MIYLAQRFRLDPNNVQRTWLERCAGASRFVYNWGLARWRERFDAGEKTSWQVLNKELNQRKRGDLEWLKEIPWAVPNRSLANLGCAFSNFFRRLKSGTGKPGYTRFKKKGRCQDSFSIEGRAVRFLGSKVCLPKIGWIKTRDVPRLSGRIVEARIFKRAGHWYLAAQVELDDSFVYPHRCETQAAIGIDLGVVDLAVLSSGEKIPAPRAYRKLELRLRHLNKQLHRRKKGSHNRKKTAAKIAQVHERISNIRRDAIHKFTTRVVKSFRWIGIEDLNVSGMVQNRRLAKSISDAAMGELVRQLKYKATLAGSTVVRADRFFPSSKRCSVCGDVVDAMPLQTREWQCAGCGTTHDRDINAAVNLEQLALAHRVTACRHGSSGAQSGTKLPLGQEFGFAVNPG